MIVNTMRVIVISAMFVDVHDYDDVNDDTTLQIMDRSNADVRGVKFSSSTTSSARPSTGGSSKMCDFQEDVIMIPCSFERGGQGTQGEQGYCARQPRSMIRTVVS